MLTFLCDLDGVIYRDHEPVPGAAEAVAVLRTLGHRVLFATNNGTRSRAEFAVRMAAVGVPATEDEIATSGYAMARYLRTLAVPPTTALVLGSAALQAELDAVGIRMWHASPPEGDPAETEPRAGPDCVVVSLDRTFTYERLALAQHAVLAGALLVATNRDPQFPGADRLYPGAGSLVAAVEAACQKQAVAIGKPGTLLYEMLLQAAGADPRRTIVIGDNLITDIAAAEAMHLASILVLTGIARREDLAGSAIQPSLVVERLTDLLSQDLEALVTGC